MERYEVGVECEVEWLRLIEAQQGNALEELLRGRSDYDATIAQANAVPVWKRAAWLKSENGDAHFAAVELERHYIAGTDPDGSSSAPRQLFIPAKRPQGHRQRILEEAATRWQVSTGTVEKCWKEVRRLQRRNKTEI